MMSGNNGYRFTFPCSSWRGDEILPLLTDSTPWWMPRDFQKPGLYIGSVIQDGENALGCIYMTETAEKEVFFCTPHYNDHGEIIYFTLSDLKINRYSERTRLQPMWG